MWRRIAELGTGVKHRVHDDGASRWGRVRTGDVRGHPEAGRQRPLGLRKSALHNLQSNPCIADPMAYRINLCPQLGSAPDRTGHRRIVCDTEAAATRQNAEWGAPEAGAEPASMRRDRQ